RLPAAAVRSRRPRRSRGRLLDLRPPPLDLLPLESTGRPARTRGAASARAPSAEDAQPALAARRGAACRLRARSSRAWSEADRLRASPSALGRHRRLRQRPLALPAPARPLDAREAPLADRPLPRPLRAPGRADSGAAHRGRAAWRAGRDRLLLRRPPARHGRRDLAA